MVASEEYDHLCLLFVVFSHEACEYIGESRPKGLAGRLQALQWSWIPFIKNQPANSPSPLNGVFGLPQKYFGVEFRGSQTPPLTPKSWACGTANFLESDSGNPRPPSDSKKLGLWQNQLFGAGLQGSTTIFANEK